MPGRRIQRLSQFRSVAIYGRSGTGKTTLAATFPKPLLHLDMRDDGTDSISDVEDVELRSLASFAELEDMYWWLTENPEEFATVVIDTVSQAQQMCILETIGEGKSNKKLGDWGSMSRRDFGSVSGTMKELLTNFRDLTEKKMNIVFIAQDRTFNAEEEDDSSHGQIDPEVGPALMPSIAKVLNASVSVLANTFIREHLVKEEKKTKSKIQFCLRIGPNPVYATKVRKPRSIDTPSYIVDPTYDDIISIIKGE